MIIYFSFPFFLSLSLFLKNNICAIISPRTITAWVEIIALICVAKKAPLLVLIKCSSWQLQPRGFNGTQKAAAIKECAGDVQSERHFISDKFWDNLADGVKCSLDFLISNFPLTRIYFQAWEHYSAETRWWLGHLGASRQHVSCNCTLHGPLARATRSCRKVKIKAARVWIK